MKGFDTFKNALTFETKRLCVSTKTPLRFNQNSLTFYLKRKGVLNRAQGRLIYKNLFTSFISRGFFKK